MYPRRVPIIAITVIFIGSIFFQAAVSTINVLCITSFGYLFSFFFLWLVHFRMLLLSIFWFSHVLCIVCIVPNSMYTLNSETCRLPTMESQSHRKYSTKVNEHIRTSALRKNDETSISQMIPREKKSGSPMSAAEMHAYEEQKLCMDIKIMSLVFMLACWLYVLFDILHCYLFFWHFFFFPLQL